MADRSDVASMTGAERAAMACLDEFMRAWNARDVAAFRATFNYPSVRIASGRVRLIEGPQSHPDDLFERMAATGWHHSAWLRRNVIHSGDDKVHFDTRFGRYRDDGTTIGEYDSIYIVSKVDGHWGVQGRSSFAP
jgi:hypothetical protein